MGQSATQKKPMELIDNGIPNLTVKSNRNNILIGREEELMALRFYMSAAAEGQGSFILTTGEAGIGKTYLIKSASQYAVEDGFSTFEIDFKAYHKFEPYSPFIDLVQKLEKGKRETNQLLEQLKVTSVESKTKKSGENGYDAELFEKLNNESTILKQIIVTWLLNASKQKPIFLFLNNLHNVSQTTMQFIHYITGKLVDQSIIICAALRQDGEEKSKDKIPLYADVLNRMGREGLVTKLPLKRLTKKHLKQFLNQRYKKSDISYKFISLVHEISDGLPLRCLDYIESLEKQKVIYKREDIWYNSDNITKQSIHNLVLDHSHLGKLRDQIKKLKDNHLEILKFAVLMEDSFNYQLMSELTNQSKISALREIEHLRNQKFLIPSDDDLFKLRHETIRIAVCKLMKDDEIVKKHKLIADTIFTNEFISEDEKVFLLAKHYHEAKQPGSAFKYLLIAGNLALKNLAFAEARDIFQKALSILGSNSCKIEKKSIIGLLIKCAWVDRILGFYKGSLNYCKRAYELVDKSDIEVYTNLLLQKGLTLFRTHKWQQSVKCFETCLEYESEMSFFDSAVASYGIACVHFHLGNYKQSRKYFERALDDVKRTKNKSFEAEILNNLGAVESVTGNSIKAVARFSESIPIYESLNDDFGLALIYNNLGLTYANGKKWHDANNCYGKCLTLCDRIEIKPLKSIVFLNRAYTMIQLDDLETAEEYNNKAFRLMERMNDQLDIAEYYKNLGVINRKKSNWVDAKKNLNKAIKMFQSLESKLGYAESAYELGILAYDMKAYEKFEYWFDDAIECCKEIGLNQKILAIEDERYQLLTKDQMNLVKVGS